MTTKNVLKSKIERLIILKNEYDEALKTVEVLRKRKTEVEEEVNITIQSLNMEGKTIIVNNQKVVQKNVSVSQSLTLKYIEQVLQQYNQKCVSQGQLNTKELLNFIKINRPKMRKTEIRIH